MRYYKYNLEYYYTGFEDSDTVLESATTVTQSGDFIIWNPETLVWEEELNNLYNFEEIKAQYQQDNLHYFDDYMDMVYGSLADFEPETYRSQEDEWRAWVIDPNVATPYVDVLCYNRGVDKETLMAKIGQKVQFFANVQGQMHHLDDVISSCVTQEELEALPLPWL